MKLQAPRRSPATRRWPLRAAIAGLVLALAACASPRHRAPVEERPLTSARPAAVPSSVTAEPVKPPPPGIENAGKPGYYTVRPGDTLIRVALENGQGWRDLARWNNLDNPNLIEVGQVLRVVSPGVDPSQPVARPVVVARVEPRPLGSPVPALAASSPVPASAAGAASAGGTAAPAAAATPAPVASAPVSPPAPLVAPAPREDDEPQWIWPAAGPVASPFEEARTKGLAIAGKAGDAVMAAADGRVIYAGSGLRGYGNLVIVKHNASYLTAYAHNQTLLVKEDQPVRRGQKIAEMGSTDADKVQLHFEIRRQGKPVDPQKLLPAR